MRAHHAKKEKQKQHPEPPPVPQEHLAQPTGSCWSQALARFQVHTKAEKLVSGVGCDEVSARSVSVRILMATSLFPVIAKGFSVIQLGSTPFPWFNLGAGEIQASLFSSHLTCSK